MKTNYDLVFDRLKEKLGITSDAALAAMFEISTSGMSQNKKRDSIPYDRVIKVCMDHNISIDYVIKGRDAMEYELMDEVDLRGIDTETFIVLPYFKDIRCAAGYGCTNDESSQSDISYIVLPRNKHPELARNNHHLHAITAQGDSMEGNITDGAILLIDLGDKGTESGRIYVVNVDGDVLVKRVFSDLSDHGNVILKSDNPYYPQFKVQKESLEVIGRVVFVFNTAKSV